MIFYYADSLSSTFFWGQFVNWQQNSSDYKDLFYLLLITRCDKQAREPAGRRILFLSRSKQVE